MSEVEREREREEILVRTYVRKLFKLSVQSEPGPLFKP